jgi:hypothetical protein
MNSWFQTSAEFCMLYVSFWVTPRRLSSICRRFGTLCLFHLHRQVVVGRLNLKIVWICIREKVWLENNLSQSGRVWRGRVGSGYYPSINMEQTECFKTSAYNSDAGELPRKKHTTFRTRRKFEIKKIVVNSLNPELNPICHLLALLGAHPVFHISSIRVNATFPLFVHPLENNICIILLLWLHQLMSGEDWQAINQVLWRSYFLFFLLNNGWAC